MIPTGDEIPESRHGLGGTVAWLGDRPTYALEGNIFSSGATVDWVARILGLESATAVEHLAASVPDAGGVHIVPAFAGLGAPHWQPEARGSITGLTFGSGPAHLARAAVESIAFQVADLVEAAEQDLDRPIDELRADGGASRNDELMQLQADLIDRPIVRSSAPDAAALGVAVLAGRAVGTLLDDLPALREGNERFEPRLATDARDALMLEWRAAVATLATPLREAVVL
jgi:glycerol kinase